MHAFQKFLDPVSSATLVLLSALRPDNELLNLDDVQCDNMVRLVLDPVQWRDQ